MTADDIAREVRACENHCYSQAVLLAIMALSGRAQASGHIYLLRGLAGIFSTGLDVLDQKLVQRGYNATVHPYDFYNSLAEEPPGCKKAARGRSSSWGT